MVYDMFSEIFEFKNGQKRPKMAKTAKNGQKLPNTAKNGQKCDFFSSFFFCLFFSYCVDISFVVS